MVRLNCSLDSQEFHTKSDTPLGRIRWTRSLRMVSQGRDAIAGVPSTGYATMDFLDGSSGSAPRAVLEIMCQRPTITETISAAVAVGMRMTPHPRTDPDERISRIRLLP